jgi:hypothetical protein
VAHAADAAGGALSSEELVTITTRLWITCWVALAAASANVAAADPGGNPYSFFGSVGECAAAERDRCAACLADNACGAITAGADGNAECRQLGDNGGRGYYLICINLSLAIDAVARCVGASAGGCAADTRASESLARLDANAAFLDDTGCSAPLDACLASLYGPSTGNFPGPGSGSGSGSGGTVVNPSRPRHTSIDCGDSCNGDANCDDTPDCELDGPSCDAESDTSCSDSSGGDGGGCSDSGGGTGAGGDGGCDSEDSCGSEDSSSCDGSDCGGGGNSDCGGGGGGGDCGGGGGGDCSGGGGGDCGGGGGDCNVTSRHGRAVASLPVAIGWALLPVPFAMLVRRRARRRRAQAQRTADAAAAAGDREVAP